MRILRDKVLKQSIIVYFCSFLSDYDHQNLDTEGILDPYLSNTEASTDQLDLTENNLQVTFSEPLTSDRPASTNDTEDGTTSEPPKSILKGTVHDRNKIFERDLDSSIMKRTTSPEGGEKTPSKPTMARRSADLRQVNSKLYNPGKKIMWTVSFLKTASHLLGADFPFDSSLYPYFSM